MDDPPPTTQPVLNKPWEKANVYITRPFVTIYKREVETTEISLIANVGQFCFLFGKNDERNFGKTKTQLNVSFWYLVHPLGRGGGGVKKQN